MFSLPPIDRDEARFAEATRRMLTSPDWHGYVLPMIQDRPRLNKPPLIYWLQAVAVAACGGPEGSCEAPGAAAQASSPGNQQPLPAGRIWAYRIPSVLGALAAVLITWRLGREMFAAPCGWLGGLLLASCLVVTFDARQARTDQVLLACTTLACWALWRLWSAPTAPAVGWALLLWTALALGMLTKGPITPTLTLLAALALSVASGRWAWLRRLRPGWGLLVFVAIGLPWVFLLAAQVGWKMVAWAFTKEVLLRSVAAQEGHAGPPGYHLLLLPVLLWPGSLALVPGLVRAVRRAVRWPRRSELRLPPDHEARGRPARRRRHWRARWQQRQPGRPAELFCLAWLLPGWVVFELLATKLPHYTLPLYPPLALLCARGLYAARSAWQPLLRRLSVRAALWSWLALGELVAVALPITLALLGRLRLAPAGLGALLGLLTVGQLLLVWLALELRRRRFVRAQLVAVGAAGVTYLAVFQCILPNLETLWLSSRLVAEVRRVDPECRRPLAAADYHEDSLIFLTQGRVRRLERSELPPWFAAHSDGLAVMAEPPEPPEFDLRRLAGVTGFNYSNGRWQRLALVELYRLTVDSSARAAGARAAAGP